MSKGWCPDLHAPMEAGDGLLLRVKPRCGVLPAAGARLIAEEAARHGSGAMELTNRANIQLRGFSAQSARSFAAAMVAAGFGLADPAAERRRNLIVTPQSDRAAMRVATALERALAADRGLSALPAKFGFLVDAGNMDARADVVLRREGATWLVGLDGDARGVAGPDPVGAALALAHAFLHVAQGAKRAQDVDPDALYADAGFRPDRPMPQGMAWSAMGPAVGPRPGGHGFALPFGTNRAAILADLAAIAERRGGRGLWITPYRSVVLDGALAADAAGLELVADPADPRLRVTACIASPICQRAVSDARADAARLAATQPVAPVHLVGCERGCSQPQQARARAVAEGDRYRVEALRVAP